MIESKKVDKSRQSDTAQITPKAIQEEEKEV